VAACAVLQPEQCVSLGILTYRDESKFPEQEIQYNAVLKNKSNFTHKNIL
jgi:hypothetical protein